MSESLTAHEHAGRTKFDRWLDLPFTLPEDAPLPPFVGVRGDVLVHPGDQLGGEVERALAGGQLGETRTVMLASEIGIVIAAADLTAAELVDLCDELGDDALVEAITPLDKRIAAVLWSSGGTRDTTRWRVV